jgi:hypothetical protein
VGAALVAKTVAKAGNTNDGGAYNHEEDVSNRLNRVQIIRTRRTSIHCAVVIALAKVAVQL